MPPKKRKDNGDDKSHKRKKTKRNKHEDDDDEDDFSDGDHGGPVLFDGIDALTEAGDNGVAADSNLKVILEPEKEVGELLISGGTNWDMTGRKQPPKTSQLTSTAGRNLYGPHRVSVLKGVPIRTIASGCLACHSVVITSEGKIYSWGRNDFGQLGLGDKDRRDVPTLIESFSSLNIVKVACGKSHTLFLVDTGSVFAAGSNSSGQLGLGRVIPPIVPHPTKVLHKGPPVQMVACGGEFSVIVDLQGNLYSFGSPEYGQLGHNSDGKYFVTSAKMSYDFKTRPQRVMLFIDKTRDGQITPVQDVSITSVACGQNHVIALDKKGRVFSWGFGGYGRLGHTEAKDEMLPRLIKFFDGPNRGATIIGAGSTYSMAVSQTGVLLLWGQTKPTGEAAMYPKPIHDLSGWKVRCLGCCHKSIVLAADNSLISWGSSPTYGELCLGENGPKSTSTPMESKPLEGIYIEKISCGWGHTLLLARNVSEEEKAKIEELPVFTS
ncbi:hypothetical protein HELRODRAFT_154695 [Helobdella robusta]|uniref:Uncharacterized protein n=1 Tax=Helobdella robusta TaxID=6412 RepID=T1ELF7_HELRO|nr:hypothetical protein HELRODRAFT_154695 [Helobdella robusta]ESO04865.1 hypothetical protein HELRODRAFT_154695 [Helobdella robusta]